LLNCVILKGLLGETASFFVIKRYKPITKKIDRIQNF
jgi:hypothetical protein